MSSRASIISSLNALVNDGVLSYREITGKGGHRRSTNQNMISSASNNISQQRYSRDYSLISQKKLKKHSSIYNVQPLKPYFLLNAGVFKAEDLCGEKVAESYDARV